MQPKGWTRGQIKGALEDHGWNFRMISDLLGHKEITTATCVLRRSYPVVEQIIADILQVPAASIWPERYTSEGAPRQIGIRRAYPKIPTLGTGKLGNTNSPRGREVRPT